MCQAPVVAEDAAEGLKSWTEVIGGNRGSEMDQKE